MGADLPLSRSLRERRGRREAEDAAPAPIVILNLFQDQFSASRARDQLDPETSSG
jgi:hypothetical protein